MNVDKAAFKLAAESALSQEGATELVFSGDENKAEWSFKLHRNGQAWPLFLRIRNWSLTPLPYLYWATTEPVWGWPHTGDDGSICAFAQGLDYDAEDYEGIIRQIIQKSMMMLMDHHAMSEPDRLNAFADELEAYARKVGIPPLALDGPLGSYKRIHADVFPLGNNLWKIERINSSEPVKNAQRQSIFVLDVDIGNLPPLVSKPDHDWWRCLCQNVPVKSRCLLEKKRGCGVILRVANRFGGAHIMLYWGNRERGNYLEIYRLESAYYEYLTRRVGQHSLSRRVAVVGVGAVGSRIAEHLTLAGIKHLTLVDPEKMSANNLGRHVLTRDYLGVNKADGMAAHLRRRMPGIDINFHHSTLLEWLKVARPNEFDVIVLATGDLAEERQWLRYAWREGWSCRLVSTFVEAANLGGHAIAMQPGEPGCLECLYEIEDPAALGFLRTVMLAPGQSPLREISGCGAFAPYSAISATRTALLAAELALPDAEIGYHRWAGSDEMAVELNLRPSDFWLALREGKAQTFVARKSYIREGCPCCGN
jgi:molybdopterin/thiamine biosynthesis adenylyltransferase